MTWMEVLYLSLFSVGLFMRIDLDGGARHLGAGLIGVGLCGLINASIYAHVAASVVKR